MKWNGKQVIKKLTQKLEKTIKEAPKVLANEGQKVFLENFKNQAWNTRPWPKRKHDTSQPILVGRTRRLINSVRKSVRQVTTSRIVWGTDVPYASVHNYGGIISRQAHKRTSTITRKIGGSQHFSGGTWKKARYKSVTFQGSRHNVSASSFRMPRRQFMGASAKLRHRLKSKFEQLYKFNLK